MDKVGKLLPKVIASQPGSRQISELRVRLALEEILGPELAKACDEVHVRGGTLSLGISNPALAHQLRLDEARLLERLNLASLGRTIRVLRVRTGRRGVTG